MIAADDFELTLEVWKLLFHSTNEVLDAVTSSQRAELAFEDFRDNRQIQQDRIKNYIDRKNKIIKERAHLSLPRIDDLTAKLPEIDTGDVLRVLRSLQDLDLVYLLPVELEVGRGNRIMLSASGLLVGLEMEKAVEAGSISLQDVARRARNLVGMYVDRMILEKLETGLTAARAPFKHPFDIGWTFFLISHGAWNRESALRLTPRADERNSYEHGPSIVEAINRLSKELISADNVVENQESLGNLVRRSSGVERIKGRIPQYTRTSRPDGSMEIYLEVGDSEESLVSILAVLGSSIETLNFSPSDRMGTVIGRLLRGKRYLKAVSMRSLFRRGSSYERLLRIRMALDRRPWASRPNEESVEDEEEEG